MNNLTECRFHHRSHGLVLWLAYLAIYAALVVPLAHLGLIQLRSNRGPGVAGACSLAHLGLDTAKIESMAR